MKPISYKGYTICRIGRCGHRRVTIVNCQRIVGDTFDGYDMDDLVAQAKEAIDLEIQSKEKFSNGRGKPSYN